MRIVIQGGDVFDGRSDEITTADVVIEGDQIVDVGSGLDGDERLDTTGLTILPGLIDAHVHVMLTTLDWLKLLEMPFSLHFYIAAEYLRKTLDAGITLVRDASGADLGMQVAVEQGLIDGASLQISLIALTQTGGHGDYWMPSGNRPWLLVDHPGRPNGVVDGPDQMRTKVRELVRAGANVIKVNTSGGSFSPRDDPRHGHFRDAELEVLVEEATAAGIYAMAHATSTAGIKSALRTGIRSIEHGTRLDDEAIELFLQHDAWLVPTLTVSQFILDAADAGAKMPDGVVQKVRDGQELHFESFRKAVSAGVKIAMGSDAAAGGHGNNLAELGLMRELGMSPSGVLKAATSSAADLMNLGDTLGSITPGLRADFTIVAGDPYDFGAYPGNVAAVIKKGRLVRGSLGSKAAS